MAPTPDKQAVLAEFRTELVQQGLLHDGDSVGTDDETLSRFLRARHYNLKQAILMWKNSHQWRATVEGVGIDELYKEIDPFDYPERDYVFDCWPLYFHKTDKDGHPLNFHHFGGIDLNKLQKKMTLERFWRTMLVNCEALPREILPAASEAAGKRILGTFVVVDLAGFGISHFWHMKDFARSSFQVSQDYFPETVARLAIVNAPRGFTAIWNVMKPWIAKETAAKVTIMGSDYRDTLLEHIDPDALPARLGGTCTCGGDGDGEGQGHGACMKSNAGPWMHERKRRREAWLAGERDTMAILPGELTGPIQVRRDVAASAEPEPERVADIAGAGDAAGGMPQARTPSDGASDASSVESSSLGTPPSSHLALADKSSKNADATESEVHEANHNSMRPEAVAAL